MKSKHTTNGGMEIKSVWAAEKLMSQRMNFYCVQGLVKRMKHQARNMLVVGFMVTQLNRMVQVAKEIHSRLKIRIIFRGDSL